CLRPIGAPRHETGAAMGGKHRVARPRARAARLAVACQFDAKAHARDVRRGRVACLPSLPLVARWHALTAAESGWYGSSARYLYANLLNSVSPGNIGGDVYRFFAFRTAERNGAALVALLVRERLLGLASML